MPATESRMEKPNRLSRRSAASAVSTLMRTLVLMLTKMLRIGRVRLAAHVASPQGQMTRCCAGEVRREHQQGLADAIRSVESAAPPMYSEVRVFVRKDLGFGCPEGMCDLQPMRGVGSAKFA